MGAGEKERYINPLYRPGHYYLSAVKQYPAAAMTSGVLTQHKAGRYCFVKKLYKGHRNNHNKAFQYE